MELKLKDKIVVVGGASSGFGKAIAESLLSEGAIVIGIARSKEKLDELSKRFGAGFESLAIDITTEEATNQIRQQLGNRPLYGVLINAGGPPAKTVMETTMEDWDEAY